MSENFAEMFEQSISKIGTQIFMNESSRFYPSDGTS